MHGCIELGCSVLALCFDDHHRTHLAPFLVQRAVEAMLGSKTFVFVNEILVARARQLRLMDVKEAKKEEEIQRVKSRAKTINFKVIGVASSTKLKRFLMKLNSPGVQ